MAVYVILVVLFLELECFEGHIWTRRIIRRLQS